jgi:hypothetical protein
MQGFSRPYYNYSRLKCDTLHCVDTSSGKCFETILLNLILRAEDEASYNFSKKSPVNSLQYSHRFSNFYELFLNS